MLPPPYRFSELLKIASTRPCFYPLILPTCHLHNIINGKTYQIDIISHKSNQISSKATEISSFHIEFPRCRRKHNILKPPPRHGLVEYLLSSSVGIMLPVYMKLSLKSFLLTSGLNVQIFHIKMLTMSTSLGNFFINLLRRTKECGFNFWGVRGI